MDYVVLAEEDMEKLLRKIQISYFYSLESFIGSADSLLGCDGINDDSDENGLVFFLGSDEDEKCKRLVYRQKYDNSNYFSN